MFNINVNDKRYGCPDSWGDLTLSKLAALQALISEHETLTDELRCKVISLLADIPLCDVERIVTDDVVTFTGGVLSVFIEAARGNINYQPQGIASFVFNGQTYVLPTTGRDVIDAPMPCEEITTKEFCEASDVISTRDFRLSPLVVAILCRPQDEVYDEKIIKARAKEFTELSTEIYLEVMSLVLSAHEYLAQDNTNVYSKSNSSSDDDQPTIMWSDRILFVADNRPSELPVVEQMRAYDFVKLLNNKIKHLKEQWRAPSMY